MCETLGDAHKDWKKVETPGSQPTWILEEKIAELKQENATLLEKLQASTQEWKSVKTRLRYTIEECDRLRERDRDSEKQLCDLSTWCEKTVGVVTNQVIGQPGWPFTLSECVQQGVELKFQQLIDEIRVLREVLEKQ